jgi:hypothetical protein
MAKNTSATATAIKAEPKIGDIDLSACATTSAKMRTLVAAGFSDGAIGKFLGKRPQHVRNVRITPVTNPRTATVS